MCGIHGYFVVVAVVVVYVVVSQIWKSREKFSA